MSTVEFPCIGRTADGGKCPKHTTKGICNMRGGCWKALNSCFSKLYPKIMACDSPSLEVFKKDEQRYSLLRGKDEVVTQGEVIMKKLAHHSVKFLHKPSVKTSADQLKEVLDFMEPRFSRFTCALSEGCPVEACQQPASVANNGFCQEHAIRGLSVEMMDRLESLYKWARKDSEDIQEPGIPPLQEAENVEEQMPDHEEDENEELKEAEEEQMPDQGEDENEEPEEAEGEQMPDQGKDETEEPMPDQDEDENEATNIGNEANDLHTTTATDEAANAADKSASKSRRKSRRKSRVPKCKEIHWKGKNKKTVTICKYDGASQHTHKGPYLTAEEEAAHRNEIAVLKSKYQ